MVRSEEMSDIIQHDHLHRTENTRYRVSFKHADNAKTDGFTVEVNGDEIGTVEGEALKAYQWALAQLVAIPEPKKKEG